MINNDKKTILITGSSRGVGKKIATYYLDNNYIVIGFSRGEKTILHDSYFHYCVDVGDVNTVHSAFTEIKKKFSKLDIVVNNAGVLTSQYSLIMSPAAAQSMLAVNLFGPFIVSRESVKIMKKNKYGRIINIGSMAARLEPIGDSIYAATKSGLITLTNILSKEYSPYGITCNTLCINAIESDMLAQLPREKINQIINTLPINRFSFIEDITNVIDFYISEKSNSITSQTIFLGGVS